MENQARDESGLRLGIMGTARIAKKFVAAVAPSRKLQVRAVASRAADAAAAFAGEFGLDAHHAGYEQLLGDPAIDAIYIPLPNALHPEWTRRSLEAGKHVICEKPLASSEAVARDLYDMAAAAGLHLVEAFPYASQPMFARMRAIAASGDLGQLRYVQASFGFLLTDSADIRLDPALDGGALTDVGVYPVSLARMLVRERPTQVSAFSDRTERGVDRTMTAMFAFPGGAVAQLACSLSTFAHRQAILLFDHGIIETDYPNHRNAANPGRLIIRRGPGAADVETVAFEPSNGFLAEAESFADLVAGREPGWTGISAAESIDVAAMVEAARASAMSGQVQPF